MAKHRTVGRGLLAGGGLLALLAVPAVFLAQQPLTPPMVNPPRVNPRQVAPRVGEQPAQAQQPPAGLQPPSGPLPDRRRGRRDPFRSLLVRADDLAGSQALPPGKRGLMVSQIRVDGIVRMPADRIALVSVPNRNRAYFLRVRDELFDGYVAEIHEDSVIFKERTRDAFGKPYEREVVKQIYAAAGATR